MTAGSPSPVEEIGLLRSGLDVRQPLPDLVDGTGILEGRRVADLLTGHEGPDHAAHDLAAPRLREFLRNIDVVGDGNRSDGLPYMFLQVLLELVRPLCALLEDDVGHERLALDGVWLADHGGLGDLSVA